MKGKGQAMNEQPASSAERHFDKTWLERAMERMERRLQAMICSSLDPVSRSVNDLEACVTAIKERVVSQEEDEQEDYNPLDSGWWRDSLAEPCLAMGRESRANPPQGGLAPANNYMGVRSTRFAQMDVDPPEDNDRQESIVNDNSRYARVEDEDKSANNLWRMHIEALFTSLNKAECFNQLQPTKWQEILMNFLQTAHLYKPSDGYKICRGPHWYTFREIAKSSPKAG